MALPADDELIAGLVARDEETFAVVVRRWSPSMLRIARYHVASAAVAEEVVQEAWVAVLSQIAHFERRSALRTWVLTICANIARRHGVREKRSLPVGLPEQDATVDPGRFRTPPHPWAGYWEPAGRPSDWGPEARVMTAESRRILASALAQLPQRQASVVALRDIHGLPTAEIAELIGASEGNVRVILHRARAALRERLAGYFVEESNAS